MRTLTCIKHYWKFFGVAIQCCKSSSESLYYSRSFGVVFRGITEKDSRMTMRMILSSKRFQTSVQGTHPSPKIQKSELLTENLNFGFYLGTPLIQIEKVSYFCENHREPHIPHIFWTVSQLGIKGLPTLIVTTFCSYFLNVIVNDVLLTV